MIDAYLKRLQYNRVLKADLPTLKALHYRHMLHVPFENLNIHIGQPIQLEIGHLMAKVLHENRGGYCYELNHLFGTLLEKIGFKLTRISAKVLNSEGELGPEFDHLALIVHLEEDWLVDVGFGDSFVHPKLLELNTPQKEGGYTYKIVYQNEAFGLWRKTLEEEYKLIYAFTIYPRKIEDFFSQNSIKQSHPDSHFVRNKMCTRATQWGRYTLYNDTFTITKDMQKEKSPVSNNEEFQQLLEEHFAISIRLI